MTVYIYPCFVILVCISFSSSFMLPNACNCPSVPCSQTPQKTWIPILPPRPPVNHYQGQFNMYGNKLTSTTSSTTSTTASTTTTTCPPCTTTPGPAVCTDVQGVCVPSCATLGASSVQVNLDCSGVAAGTVCCLPTAG